MRLGVYSHTTCYMKNKSNTRDSKKMIITALLCCLSTIMANFPYTIEHYEGPVIDSHLIVEIWTI